LGSIRLAPGALVSGPADAGSRMATGFQSTGVSSGLVTDTGTSTEERTAKIETGTRRCRRPSRPMHSPARIAVYELERTAKK
jgi:hypothetical protein